MMKALKPFWIYWGAIVFGCVLFFLFPLILFIFFSVMIFLVPLWFAVVYAIGMAVQKRSMVSKRLRRILLALFCSLLTVLIFPVGVWICDVVKWGHFYFHSLVSSLDDPALWIAFAVHAAAFWIGEETERLCPAQRSAQRGRE